MFYTPFRPLLLQFVSPPPNFTKEKYATQESMKEATLNVPYCQTQEL